MKRYSREEMLIESGARPEELMQLEAQRLLVPNRRWRLFGKGEEYFTDGQLDVLRLIVKARRTMEAHRQPRQAADLAQSRMNE